MAKLVIKIEDNVLEIEGTENFIAQHYKELLIDIKESKKNQRENIHDNKIDDVVTESQTKNSIKNLSKYEFFGDYYGEFDKTKLKNVDKTLIASYYVQTKSETKDFNNHEVNKELNSINVKTNSSHNTNLNIKKEYVYKTKDKRFRVSEKGVAYLETIKNNAI